MTDYHAQGSSHSRKGVSSFLKSKAKAKAPVHLESDDATLLRADGHCVHTWQRQAERQTLAELFWQGTCIIPEGPVLLKGSIAQHH